MSDTLIYKVIDFLKFRGQHVLVAPYESDSQLAYLFKEGRIDYIVSEDSDMFALNCLKIIKGLKCTGECKFMDLVKESSKTVPIQQMLKLSSLKSRKTTFKDLCDVWM